ncbi:hypothetical protein [Candidatus Tisiphia endosymbiont of Sialis lutaria]|uniref:hypothetical protein n=1 Tax=Candidatus Tisiphia endosymbiont of Sialis lutaria TaxID=2029164 RepID=UPI0039776D3B
MGSRNDGATPISNRRTLSNDVTNFSSIDYKSTKNLIDYFPALFANTQLLSK